MLLNRFETLLMNNPVRASIQRSFEARRLERMGGITRNGHVLEVGCGRGVGVEILLDRFHAARVDAFDLDPKMVARARRRARRRRGAVTLWVGDATRIKAQDDAYDAVFDFGIIHHIPDWRAALREVHRVLKPGGRFFCEEVHERLIVHPLWRRLLDHPMEDRFDHAQFLDELRGAGFDVLADERLWGWFGWYVADKPRRMG